MGGDYVPYLFYCQWLSSGWNLEPKVGEFHSLNKDAGAHLTHIHPPPTHRDT